jgi:hypothetical protein
MQCEREGPLTPWRTLLKAVLARFNASLGDRDLFAHDRMQVLSGPGDTFQPRNEPALPQAGRQVASCECARMIDRNCTEL